MPLSSLRHSPTTRQDVELWRERTFRRTPERSVRGERSALRFVDEVGFCFTLSDFGLPVPSLYVAVCGRRRPRFGWKNSDGRRGPD